MNSPFRGAARRQQVCFAGLVVLSLAMTCAVGVAYGAKSAAAATNSAPPPPIRVEADGAPIGSVATTPQLVPGFSADIHDYAMWCGDGPNNVTIAVAGMDGGGVTMDGRSGGTVTKTVVVGEGQALILAGEDFSGAEQTYWIRCLPHDFPHLAVNRPGSPTPGWYLTGTTGPGPGAGSYAMILDTNGTPVWYAPAPNGALDVQPTSDGGIAFNPILGPGFGVGPNPGITLENLDGSSERHVVAAGGLPTDLHEFLQLPNGDDAVLSFPPLSGVDLTPIGLGANSTIADCVVQELDPSGNLVWQWRASDHMGVGESQHPQATSINGAPAEDIYHCNSIDEDGSGHVLVSMRHLNAVVAIDKASGSVLWKLGGTSTTREGAPVLAIQGDPEQSISGQHDARFQSNGDIGVYDDHSWLPGPARGVEYSIDTVSSTATLQWQYTAPTGKPSLAMGSFRPQQDGESVIGWGLAGGALLAEANSSGQLAMEVDLASGQSAYRVVKAPLNTYSVDVLRATAGMTDAPAPQDLVASTNGYWLVGADGGVFAFGSDDAFGSAAGIPLNQPVVGVASTSGARGYWLVAADGGVFPFGNAVGYGSTGGIHLNQPIVGMAATPTGAGYWLVAADGGIFPFGDAVGYGSTGGIHLNQPIVGMAATPTGAGYWLVAADGGIFTFGDARGFGSTGNARLSRPMVGMAATVDGRGYWLVAADGGIFPFGDAFGYGSTGGSPLNQPMVGMSRTASGRGYWLVGADGGIFPFGDAPGIGSTGGMILNRPVVGMVGT